MKEEQTEHVTGYWIRHAATKGIRKIRGILEQPFGDSQHLYEKRGDHKPPQGGVIGKDVFLDQQEAIKAAIELLHHQIGYWSSRVESARKNLLKLGGIPKDPETPITLQQAVARLRKSLLGEPDYRIGWQANIAMAFYDAVRNDSAFSSDPNGRFYISHEKLHAVSNQAADNFLKLLENGA